MSRASGLVGVGMAALLVMPLVIGVTALELLVAFLQAYVFAILTCVYLNDALHPGGHWQPTTTSSRRLPRRNKWKV